MERLHEEEEKEWLKEHLKYGIHSIVKSNKVHCLTRLHLFPIFIPIIPEEVWYNGDVIGLEVM